MSQFYGNLKKHHKKNSHISYNSWLVNFNKFIVPPFLKWFFRTSVSGVPMRKIQSPYILLAQHSSVWDPVVYNETIREPLHFIVSDAQFRLPIMKFILSLVGSVAKKKSQEDMRTVSEMLFILKRRKESICIFPEGVNTWNGVSSVIVPSTAKLIKHVQLPVICVKSHGAYLSFPRWAHRARRGIWKVHYMPCLTPKQIASMSEHQILLHIQEALYNDEYENQKKHTMQFISSQSAEYIERVLFACPQCESVQSIVSKNTLFHCTMCCNMWRMNADGFITIRVHEPHKNTKDTATIRHRHFRTIKEWDIWQNEFLQTILTSAPLSKDSPIFYDSHMYLRYGIRRPVYKYPMGSCSITREHFIFTPHATRSRGIQKNAHNICIPIPHMKSINVQNSEKLEWTTPQGMIYQLQSKHPRGNTYKYMRVVQMLQQNMH